MILQFPLNYLCLSVLGIQLLHGLLSSNECTIHWASLVESVVDILIYLFDWRSNFGGPRSMGLAIPSILETHGGILPWIQYVILDLGHLGEFQSSVVSMVYL